MNLPGGYADGRIAIWILGTIQSMALSEEESETKMKMVEQKEEWKTFTTREAMEDISHREEEFILYSMAEATSSISFGHIFK